MYDYLLMNVANFFLVVVFYNLSIDFANAAREGLACFPKQRSHLAPNPDDCGSYLICNNEKYLKVLCPKTLHFDPKRKTCNYADRVSFKNLHMYRMLYLFKKCLYFAGMESTS